MKEFLIIIGVLLIGMAKSNGQPKGIAPEDRVITGVSCTGFFKTYAGAASNAPYTFAQEVRSLGKARKKDGYFFVEGPTLDGVAYVGLKLYANIEQADGQSTVWMGYPADGQSNESLEESLKAFMTALSDVFYTEGVKKEIGDAERALQYTKKQEQKLLRMEREYHAQLEDAQEEKARIEKALAAAVAKISELQALITANKASQDSVRMDLEKLQQASQATKAKLKAEECP